MLIVQIALGILLAGFLYRYWRKIGVVAGWSILILAFCIALYLWGWMVLRVILGLSLLGGIVQRIRLRRRTHVVS